MDAPRDAVCLAGVVALRLLVTGGMGFIGSNFIRHMLAVHDDVAITNLDRLSYGSNPANLADIPTATAIAS